MSHNEEMRCSRGGLVLVALLALAGCSGKHADEYVKQSAAGKRVVAISNKNPAYQKAVAEARQTMPSFLKRLAKPKPHELFSVDAGLRNSKGLPEWIWIRNVKFAKGKFSGVLTDEPLDVPGEHEGDSVTVDEKDVDDWSIRHDNDPKKEGSFTKKVLDEVQAATQLK